MLLTLLNPARAAASVMEEHAFLAHMLRTGAFFEAAEHFARKLPGSVKGLYERALKGALDAGHPVSCVTISATSASDSSKVLKARMHLLDVRSEVLHALLHANPYASDGLSNFALSHAASPLGFITGYASAAKFKVQSEKTVGCGGRCKLEHCSFKVRCHRQP